MKALFKEAAVVVAALVVAAAAVQGARDRTTMVPPPERVVEEFLRALSAERFSAARDKLADELRRRVEEDALRRQTRALEGARGRILHAEAEPRSVGEAAAEVAARLTFARGPAADLTFRLEQSRGLWKISDLGSLSPSPE